MNNYYRRSNTPVSRSSRVIESENRKIKNIYKLAISFGVSLITLVVGMLGYDYFVVLIPAIIGMTLLLGSVEKDTNLLAYLLPFAFIMPVACGLFTGASIAGVILQIAILVIAVILSINYRPFIWKRSVLLGDLPLWYFILFGAVTNAGTGIVLVLSVVIKALIATTITLGIVFAVRVLLTGEEIHKWTTQG